MSMRDVLLQIDSYPEATPPEAIEQAVRFTAAIGGVLSALAVEVDIRAPSNGLADYLIGLSSLAADEEQKSRSACQAALQVFSAKAKAAGVLGDALHGRSVIYCIGDYVAERARTRDLCIVPVADGTASASVVPLVHSRPRLAGCAGSPRTPIILPASVSINTPHPVPQ